MRAVDTNVVVRVITRDDPAQAETADAYIRGGAWVSQVVLAEVTWTLSAAYGLRPAAIARVVSMLLEHDSIVLEQPDVVALALERFKARPSVGFSDYLILEAAHRAGHLPLGTFDKNLARLEGAERL